MDFPQLREKILLSQSPCVPLCSMFHHFPSWNPHSLEIWGKLKPPWARDETIHSSSEPKTTGRWLTYPCEKSQCSSIGMIIIPTSWEKTYNKTHVPVTTNQLESSTTTHLQSPCYHEPIHQIFPPSAPRYLRALPGFRGPREAIAKTSARALAPPQPKLLTPE